MDFAAAVVRGQNCMGMAAIRALLEVEHKLRREYEEAPNQEASDAVGWASSVIAKPLDTILFSIMNMMTLGELSELDKREFNSMVFELTSGDVQQHYNRQSGVYELGFGAGVVNVDYEEARLAQIRAAEENRRNVPNNIPFIPAGNWDEILIHPRAQG